MRESEWTQKYLSYSQFYSSVLFGFCCFGFLAFQNVVEARKVCLHAYNRTEISEDDSDHYGYEHYLSKKDPVLHCVATVVIWKLLIMHYASLCMGVWILFTNFWINDFSS